MLRMTRIEGFRTGWALNKTWADAKLQICRKREAKNAILIKATLSSFLLAMAASWTCLAQSPSSITVTVGASGNVAACTFTASSIMNGFTNSVKIGGGSSGGGAGKASASPLNIVKQVDRCSIPLILDLFKGTVIPTVTININGTVGGNVVPVLTLTLTDAFVTSLSDSDSKSEDIPLEKVTLIYESIKITDQLDNTSVTCDFVTNTCS